ncbi:MAG: Uncharacterized protein G01um101420_350 [Parcubacteria group bacterium Gr01-1014_20]|nr:MAG: Uncharacterized protein G01um101420_350 [Parcubacteria group bacterium Gr01-1014_20]
MYNDFQTSETFKEKNGYDVGGVWYPRVTKIVDIKAKPALYRFYAGVKNFAEGESVKNKSASEGTAVHEAVEAILLGREPKNDPKIQPAIKSFQDFINQKNIHVTEDFVEKRVVNHNHRYAGTVDAVAFIDGKLGVLDIKTSQAIYRDYNLQTSAYMDALKDEFTGLETRWILKIDQIQTCQFCGARRRLKGGIEKIKPNGRLPCLEHAWSEMRGDIEFQEFPHWQNDFAAFLGAKKLWEWENESSLKKIGYL